MAKQIIRSIRKGSVQWNEEDRLQMVSMLAKAGYAVQVVRKEVPAGHNPVRSEERRVGKECRL